jgi:hypothetical protein
MYLDTDTRRLLANERIAALRGTPSRAPRPPRRRLRRAVGGWLIAAGTRLAPEVRPAPAGRPRARRA